MLQSPSSLSDQSRLTSFGPEITSQTTSSKIRSYLSASFLCIFLLLSMINTSAQAQSESSEVQLPQALAPEAMKALVSKLDEEQTAALIGLI